MPRRISEELTRKEMIDPQLETAGWFLRDTYLNALRELPFVCGEEGKKW
jgi:hypothetical protein